MTEKERRSLIATREYLRNGRPRSLERLNRAEIEASYCRSEVAFLDERLDHLDEQLGDDGGELGLAT